MRTRREVRNALVATAIFLAICGSALASTPVTPAAFRAKANGLCAAFNAKIHALPASDNTPQELLRFDAENLALVRQLQAVKAPADLAAAYQRFVAQLKRVDYLAYESVVATNKGEATRANQLDQETAQLPASYASPQEAKMIGVPACAVSPIPGGGNYPPAN
jgi:hypothetical protein